jgi:hypothetical protein
MRAAANTASADALAGSRSARARRSLRSVLVHAHTVSHWAGGCRWTCSRGDHCERWGFHRTDTDRAAERAHRKLCSSVCCPVSRSNYQRDHGRAPQKFADSQHLIHLQIAILLVRRADNVRDIVAGRPESGRSYQAATGRDLPDGRRSGRFGGANRSAATSACRAQRWVCVRGALARCMGQVVDHLGYFGHCGLRPSLQEIKYSRRGNRYGNN